MRTNEPLIFIIEDDFVMNELIIFELSEQGYNNVAPYFSGESALENLYKIPDIVICDFFLMGKINGEEILKQIKAFNPDIQVIMLSGQEKMEVAINSLKFGAYDYIVKDDNAVSRIGTLVKKIDDLNRSLKSDKSGLTKVKRFFSTFISLTL